MSEEVTFDDDFIKVGGVTATLKSLGLTWPPPLFIEVDNHGERPNLFLKRIAYSQITSAQRKNLLHLARGAQYVCVPRSTVESLTEPIEQPPKGFDSKVSGWICGVCDGWNPLGRLTCQHPHRGST